GSPRARGQPLPLHRLSQHRQGRAGRRRHGRGGDGMSATGTDTAATTGAAETGEAWVGREMRRKEDPRMITGRATYTDNMTLPGTLYVAIVRSPEAHARIVS